MTGLGGALLRYRVMANVVGVFLIILVFVGMTLQFAAHNKSVVEIVGPLHGFLYIVYLITALDLALRRRWTLLQLAGMVCAGLLPGLAFYMEHRVTRRIHDELAGGGEPEPAWVTRLVRERLRSGT